MSKDINNNLFDLLVENDESKINDFLFSKGKSPKVICPVIFNFKEEKGDEYADGE